MGRSNLLIIQEAERLQDFIFEVTSKEPKHTSGEKTDEKSLTGIPKKYRISISARLQNYSLDLFEQLDRARFDVVNRKNHLNDVLYTLRMIENVLWLCFRRKCISDNTVDRGVKLVGAVKGIAITWRDKK